MCNSQAHMSKLHARGGAFARFKASQEMSRQLHIDYGSEDAFTSMPKEPNFFHFYLSKLQNEKLSIVQQETIIPEFSHENTTNGKTIMLIKVT